MADVGPVNPALVQSGRYSRTVHLAFSLGVSDEAVVPDLALESSEPGGTLSILTFVDSADGVTDCYVLNEEYRRQLVSALAVMLTEDGRRELVRLLTGGVEIPPGIELVRN